MSIWDWGGLVEAVPEEARVILGEGGTPLVPSRRLHRRLGLNNLLWKLEMTNPTGSYKDRFAAAAISHMVAAGQTRCLATSSGNTGASLAAYCAAAGIACRIAVVETAPVGKLQQMLAYGAEIFRIRGFGLDSRVTQQCIELLEQCGQRDGDALQISAFKYSPLGMSGVRSMGYELAEQLPTIDHIFCPAGGGGATLAVAEAYLDLVQRGALPRTPRVHCVQPVGNNTIAGPLRDGAERAQDVECTSKISGLQVASVIDGHEVIPACRATGGTGVLVEDEQVWQAQRWLAREEGVFSEPAGAVSVAGAWLAAQQGIVAADETVVCLVTGSGFKDPVSVERLNHDADAPMLDISEVRARL